jgi:hypothetical protein
LAPPIENAPVRDRDTSIEILATTSVAIIVPKAVPAKRFLKIIFSLSY